MKLKYYLPNINNGKLNRSSGIRGYFIKFFVYSGVTFLSLFLGYCDENVDPKAPFKERYIFNLVIRGDTTYQIATLTKSYTVEGLDPYENQVDPAIKDADIRVWSKDDVYIMRDTAVARQDTSRYKTPVNFYYIKNFTPVSETPIDVRVELNNGRILTASTKIPAKMDIDSVDLLIPSKDKPNFSYVWKNNDGGTFYLYRFRFYYTFTDNSKVTWFIKEVPLTYIKSGTEYYPYFPSITKNTNVFYDNSALDSAMVQISKGVIDKSKFEIKKAEFEVLIFDKVLSDYYSSTHGYLDDYSVRIDQTDYTNINGGYGVFASYLDQKINVEFTEKYVISFGYKFGF